LRAGLEGGRSVFNKNMIKGIVNGLIVRDLHWPWSWLGSWSVRLKNSFARQQAAAGI
jgi:hypothetical protein